MFGRYDVSVFNVARAFARIAVMLAVFYIAWLVSKDDAWSTAWSLLCPWPVRTWRIV